jgi:Phage integrase, N-terminal SAM-like domain
VDPRPNAIEYGWRPTANRTATTNLAAVDAGAVRRPPPTAQPREAPPLGVGVAAAVEQFIAAGSEGRVLNRSGREYQPSAMRDLVGLLRHHVVPELGDLRLRAVTREHVQGLVDRLAGSGLSESRIRSVISALRALFSFAIAEGHADVSPVDGLVMPRRAAPPEPEPPPAVAAWRPDPAGWDTDSVWALSQERPREERPREERPHEERPHEERPYEERPREERREQRRAARQARSAEDDYRPMALLPEGVLGIALRAAFVLFVLLAIVSLLQSG